MHASSRENMCRLYERHIKGTALEKSGALVLDVGASDVNGSYRGIFPSRQFRYLGADMADGPGVDIILGDPYKIPLPDASIDIVISGQMLEHCEFFWLAFAEMVRVVKPDGLIFLIAPSGGPIHRYPVDCYRFYPDAFRALAKWTNCHVVELHHDERGPWRDLAGVFSKHYRIPAPAKPEIVSAAVPSTPRKPILGPPEEEAVRGDAGYLDVLAAAHRCLEPASYLEIGVRHGDSLRLAGCPAIGVDPQPMLREPLPASAEIHAMTSDKFFEEQAAAALSAPPDIAFIDGEHLFEYALRDFMNIERRAAPGTLVVIDDIFPNHPRQSTRERATRTWTGDVWKLFRILSAERPGLFLLPLDTHPTGLLLVTGLDPKNNVLWERYNPLVHHYALEKNAVPPADIIERRAALSGKHPFIEQMLGQLRSLRLEAKTGAQITKVLREALQKARSIAP